MSMLPTKTLLCIVKLRTIIYSDELNNILMQKCILSIPGMAVKV